MLSPESYLHPSWYVENMDIENSSDCQQKRIQVSFIMLASLKETKTKTYVSTDVSTTIRSVNVAWPNFLLRFDHVDALHAGDSNAVMNLVSGSLEQTKSVFHVYVFGLQQTKGAGFIIVKRWPGVVPNTQSLRP